MVLGVVVLIVMVSAVRQIVRGRGRRIVTPFVVAVGSGAFLYYSVRWLPNMLAQIQPHVSRWLPMDSSRSRRLRFGGHRTSSDATMDLHVESRDLRRTSLASA